MKLLINIDPLFLTENINPQIQILDEIGMLESQLESSINVASKIPNDVLNSFKIKNGLNPELWDNFKLKPEVKEKLIQIAETFLLDLDIPKEIIVKDILITGSLANYNWSKFSDVDLHIVLDFNQFNTSPKIMDNYFHAHKIIWNNEHDIKIGNYPIELFVQDVNHQMESKGVFSVIKNKWLNKPSREEYNIEKDKIKTKATDFIYKLKDIKQDLDDKQYQKVIDNCKKLKNKIKQMRNAGLERGGELSTENIIFKVLRRINLIDTITLYKNKAYDKLLSVDETLNETNKPEWSAVILIKGETLPHNRHHLYVTNAKNVITTNKLHHPSKVAILGNDIYQLKMINGRIKPEPVNWKSHAKMLSSMGLEKNSVVISNDKTPLHWLTLKSSNLNNTIDSIQNELRTLRDVIWE